MSHEKPPDEHKCPACQTILAGPDILLWRPFSCPTCNEIIEPVFYPRGRGIGCLSSFLLVAVLLGLSGMKWYWSALIGAGAGVLLSLLRVQVARRFWPKPYALRRHIFRTETPCLLEWAELLESIAAAEAWTDQLEHRLLVIDGQRSRDDSLENAAADSAQSFKRSIQGIPVPKKYKQEAGLTLDESRERIRLIARDLHFAAKP